jgi:hypothetical protein
MTPDLSPDLLPIAKLLDRSRPQVLVVVGTGVAINATGFAHASWLGLLKHGIRHLVQKQFRPGWGVELEASLEAAFSPFKLQSALQHANLVEQALNTPDDKAFAQWLESAFANFKPRNEEKAKAPLQVLRDLHEAGALLLTTNYDSLLSDITGAPPVTWEEHAEFHRVMTRQKAGILHIHGHWQRPSSIVLGRSSYDRVVADAALQQLFRTLWLDWSWIYVGCGDGLDDPNLGCLLEWSKEWGESGLPDFFLARDDKAKAIATRPSKPPNLQAIGYGSHDALPGVLRSVTPAARCWPFVPVDDSFPLFHLPGASDPFPSRQDYLDGTVPAFAADAELLARLQTHGWACCIDVASVGKTTLALRVACTPEQRAHPVFYLDLKRELEDDADASPVAAVGRLARAGTLLILDNSHYQPELARQLWEQWHAKPAESRGRLLLIATRIHQPVVVTPEQDLIFFERHPINPAIFLQPTPEDLGSLAKHLYRRIGGTKCPPMPEPPADVLADWHATYRAALNAFTFAVLDTLADFQKGKWSLPPTRASAWVRKQWLSKLDAPELENAICLAAFGSQELELLVLNDALPQPGKLEKLFELGLVSQALRGLFNQYRQFELREPGWGRLILAALTPSVDEEEILFATASRNLQAAIVLSSRLCLEGDKVRFKRLWAYLAPRADQLVKQLWDVPLFYLQNLLLLAKVGDQPQLLARFWEAIETDLDALADSAWAAPLDQVGSFLKVAKQQGRNTAPLWAVLESQPDKFAASAWATSLGNVGSFLKVAKQHSRDTAPLWAMLESQPDKFAASAWATSLGNVGSFLKVAKQQGRNTAPLWAVLASQPDKFAASAWATSLQNVGSFLNVAKQRGRDTAPLWATLESQPDKFAASAWATSLQNVGSFLNVAKQRGRDTAPLWAVLESQPDKFAASAWATSLQNVGSFLNVAKQHGRDTAPLWAKLESQPDKFAASAWATSLQDVGWFLNVAKQQGRNTAPLWAMLESQPDKFAASAWATSLGNVGSFLKVAKQQGRNTAPLWAVLESQPDKFAASAWAAPLDQVGSFLNVAKQQGRNTAPLWAMLESQPDKFAASAWATSLGNVGSFLKVAKQQGRNTAPLWAVLESQPDKFAASAWAAPLHFVGSCLNVAKQQGRDTAPLWAVLESQPDKFAASAWATSLHFVGSCLNVAKQHGRDTAPLWAMLESQPDKFAASAWAAPLDQVGSFLNVAKQQGRDTAPLWVLLESQPNKFADRVQLSSLKYVRSFLKVAEQHGRHNALLGTLLENKLKRLSHDAGVKGGT